MLRELVRMAPFLSGIGIDRAQEISNELMRMWDIEKAGGEFQRTPGQSIEQRLEPGFFWIIEVEGEDNLFVAYGIRSLSIYAAHQIDKNSGKFVDAARLEKLRVHVSSLMRDKRMAQVSKIVTVEAISVMDYWN